MKTYIAANPSAPTFTISLELTSVLLTSLVSVSMLIGLAIKMISKFNTITNDIRDLREDLNSHASVISDVKLLQKDALALDKKFDIHLSSYANRNDVVQMVLGQINEKIDHKWERVEGMIKEVREETKDVEKEVKDVQKYLQKQGQFTIRDYPDR